MNTHTAGPWKAVHDVPNWRWVLHGNTQPTAFGHFVGWSPDGVTTEEEDAANSARIVACVNALDGVANPGAVPRALGILRRGVGLIRTYQERGLRTDREALNHLEADAREALAALEKPEEKA